jgi:hypothetical protein
VFQLADMRASKPERVLYVEKALSVKSRQRGFWIRAALIPFGDAERYAVGVAADDAAGIGTALASV